MALTCEAGANWEILRGYTSPGQAYRAGVQALWLSQLDVDYVHFLDEDGDRGTEGLSSSSVNTEELRLDQAVSDKVSDLVNLYERTSTLVDSNHYGFIVNMYKPFGMIRWHRDYESVTEKGEDTVAIGLLHPAELAVIDPSTGQEHIFTLNPGDGFYLHNPQDVPSRPLHQVRNPFPGHRVALVN